MQKGLNTKTADSNQIKEQLNLLKLSYDSSSQMLSHLES